MGRADEKISFLTHLALDEKAVVISPHSAPFERLQRSFLDGIRGVPASISCPPGTNPFTHVLHRPGRWAFVWVPED